MDDLFDAYERDLEGVLAAMSSSQSRGGTATGFQQLAAEADSIIWKMSSEARSQPHQQKQSLLTKVPACECQHQCQVY